MKHSSNHREVCALSRWTTPILGVGLAAFLLSITSADAVEVEGFTEPYKTVDVAAADPGIVMSVPVRVGDQVAKGDLIAKLDSDLHFIMLGMAQDQKEARGRLEAAIAEIEMRETRFNKLSELHGRGFGRQEEVQRAAADLDIAQAQLQSVRDDLADKRWQHQKLAVELERRTIKSPLDGVVVARLKEPGEYVAPNEPNVVTVVQLNPLLAKFSMKRTLARHVGIGQKLQVTLPDGNSYPGIVDSISPVIDAQSGTLKVKVRIENPSYSILSGERCMVDIPLKDQPSSQAKQSDSHR